jgi:hypothetical protein
VLLLALTLLLLHLPLKTLSVLSLTLSSVLPLKLRYSFIHVSLSVLNSTTIIQFNSILLLQERLKEIPTSTSTPSASSSQFYSQPLTHLPGSEFDKPFLDANSQVSFFIS